MTKLNPYIKFRGQAKEAIEFYQAALGGKVTLNTFKESGMPVAPEEENQIMHGQLDTDNGLTVMVSDTPKQYDVTLGTNVSISLSGDDEKELRAYWEKLSEGGKISQPLEKAPWGDTFGMLADKFGIEWMVNIAGKHE